MNKVWRKPETRFRFNGKVLTMRLTQLYRELDQRRVFRALLNDLAAIRQPPPSTPQFLAEGEEPEEVLDPTAFEA